jgi:hypothetical protein
LSRIDRFRNRVKDAVLHFRPRRSGERKLPRCHLVDDDSQAEHVAARINVAARDLFGAHVRRRPDDAADGGNRLNGPLAIQIALVAAGHFRHAEIEHLHDTAARQHQVGGFDISVRDALRVREIQRVRGLHGDIDNLGRCHSTADPRQKRLSVDVLHDDEGDAIALADVVNGGHVRMVQRGCGLRFAREAVHAVHVRRELFGQDFQGDGPVQSRIAREVDLSHSAGTEQRQDLVVTDGFPDEVRLTRRTRRGGRDVHRRPLHE